MAKNKKKVNLQQESTVEERSDTLEFRGLVEEALPGTLFKVKVNETGMTVLCTLSGKLRQNHITILPGDSVVIEISVYDTTKGRIKWRI